MYKIIEQTIILNKNIGGNIKSIYKSFKNEQKTLAKQIKNTKEDRHSKHQSTIASLGNENIFNKLRLFS